MKDLTSAQFFITIRFNHRDIMQKITVFLILLSFIVTGVTSPATAGLCAGVLKVHSMDQKQHHHTSALPCDDCPEPQKQKDKEPCCEGLCLGCSISHSIFIHKEPVALQDLSMLQERFFYNFTLKSFSHLPPRRPPKVFS